MEPAHIVLALFAVLVVGSFIFQVVKMAINAQVDRFSGIHQKGENETGIDTKSSPRVLSTSKLLDLRLCGLEEAL